MSLDGVTWTVDDLDDSRRENIIMKKIASSHDQVQEKKQSMNKRLIKFRSSEVLLECESK